jgi:uncharacterized SAM-binding protein YcdF (DUF218 family)
MFFVLSKTLNYFTMPLTVIIVLLLASVFVKRSSWKRKLFWSGLGLLLFFTNDFIANEVMGWWEGQPTPFAALKTHEIGIVLTGTTISTPVSDRIYFARGADRVYHTVQLYKIGLIKKILISGGSGKILEQEEPEAEKFRKAMIIMGVPDSAMIIENETRNTHESAIEVKKLLAAQHVKDVDCLIITSGYHMRRSLACYEKVGLNPEPFRTDFYSHERDFYFDSLIIPRIEALNIWQRMSREWVGFIAYKIAGYL